jgi:hypothetical protein
MQKTSAGQFEIKDLLSRHGFLIFSLCLALFSFTLLPDYGIVGDTPKNVAEGRVNLDFLLEGKKPVDRSLLDLTYQIHGAFFFMCAEIAKRLVSDTLGWVDPISARHVLLPVCVFFFMNAFFSFLKKNANSWIAWIAATVLWTYPRFWGLIFNDIKDLPLLLFFSLFIFFVYGWITSHGTKTRLLYGASVMLGLGLANKITILLAPLIVLIWWVTLKISEGCLIRSVRSILIDPLSREQKKMFFHMALCGGITVLLAAFFFMPAFYAVAKKMGFLESKHGIVMVNLFSVFSKSWNLYPWVQILSVTPCLVLIAALAGFFRTLFRPASRSLDLLMLVWFLLITLIFCTPLLVVYHGIRLFLPFLVPFCYFVARGTFWIGEIAGKFFHVKKEWLIGVFAGLMLGSQIFGLIQTHPYQCVYYNAFVGGLKGAQEKNMRDANDFWNSSSRELSRWINQNLPPKSMVFFPTVNAFQMFRYYGARPDIHYDFVSSTPLPRHAFLVYLPSTHPGKDSFGVYQEEIQREADRMTKIHEVRRQGGLIFSIYADPRT